jgi:hypothetical protein
MATTSSSTHVQVFSKSIGMEGKLIFPDTQYRQHYDGTPRLDHIHLYDNVLNVANYSYAEIIAKINQLCELHPVIIYDEEEEEVKLVPENEEAVKASLSLLSDELAAVDRVVRFEMLTSDEDDIAALSIFYK